MSANTETAVLAIWFVLATFFVVRAGVAWLAKRLIERRGR